MIIKLYLLGGNNLIVGVFSPVINWCGGAEWVAINIIAALKKHGHQVIVLSDKIIDQKKIKSVFNREISVDSQIIFPLRFFSSPTNYHNIYTDSLRSLMLKSKCDVLIDTFSNALLPGVDIAYIHHPLLKKIEMELPFRRNQIFFYPYQNYLNSSKKNLNNKLIFANSRFTAKAVKTEFGIDPYVLYPPISNDFKNCAEKNMLGYRNNNVITVARICKEKNLNIIPYLAKSTDNKISFTIVGLLDSKEILTSLQSMIMKFKLSNRVRILTNVTRDHLKELLLTSKVYLHPSINEHFGISIVEAMSLGCIPIVHDSGGPKEFVPQNLRFKNIADAAEKVEKTIANWTPTKATEFSSYADRFSEKTFSTYFINALNSYFDKKKINK